MIVFGLGSGRSGSQSLARLLDAQAGAFVTHEKNPHVMAWSGAEPAVLENLREFERALSTGIPRLSVTLEETNRDVIERMARGGPVRLIGDVASYYLPYVSAIHDANPDVRFVCLKRDREETVRSFLAKTFKRRSLPFLRYLGMRRVKDRNHWVAHDGRRWDLDPLWDRCFPKYETNSKRQAIEMYWDEYYGTAARLELEMPGRFRVFPLASLNDAASLDAILEFVGVPKGDRALEVGLRVNVRATTRR